LDKISTINSPIVSIFVCTYNQEKYIEETLNSFLSQKCDFTFEIIIADDCSKDSTLEICQHYQKSNKEIIKIISRKKNLGLIKNFFTGIIFCQGKYIAMCGGDDYWTDSLKLQKQISFLEQNSDYVISYGDSLMINEKGFKISDSEVGTENLKNFSKEELQKGAFISTRTMCFRNIIDFETVNYKGITQEDAFIISLLGEYGKGKYLKEIKPSVYRILEKGIWSSQNEIERLKSSLKTFSVLKKIYEKKNNDKLRVYYHRKCIKNNNRILYLSINKKLTKQVLSSYILSLKQLKNIEELVTLNKTVLKYFINYFKI
tara:strand:+ start:9187 stop:10134 length:948 start_codon:yes stop_codon:yes gene_type:complete